MINSPVAVPRAGYKNDRAKLFLVVPEDVTRGSSHTQQMGRFRMAIRKTFSARYSREVMVAPLWRLFMTWQNKC